MAHNGSSISCLKWSISPHWCWSSLIPPCPPPQCCCWWGASWYRGDRSGVWQVCWWLWRWLWLSLFCEKRPPQRWTRWKSEDQQSIISMLRIDVMELQKDPPSKQCSWFSPHIFCRWWSLCWLLGDWGSRRKTRNKITTENKTTEEQAYSQHLSNQSPCYSNYSIVASLISRD